MKPEFLFYDFLCISIRVFNIKNDSNGCSIYSPAAEPPSGITDIGNDVFNAPDLGYGVFLHFKGYGHCIVIYCSERHFNIYGNRIAVCFGYHGYIHFT